MQTEKYFAFYQSWAAMWMKAVEIQIRMLTSIVLPPPTTITSAVKAMNRAAARNEATVTALLNAGLKPVHSTVISNSKRLARKRTV